MLDHATQERMKRLQALLFSTCIDLGDERLNVCLKVIDVLTAYLIMYFPQLKALGPEAPFVLRVKACTQSP